MEYVYAYQVGILKAICDDLRTHDTYDMNILDLYQYYTQQHTERYILDSVDGAAIPATKESYDTRLQLVKQFIEENPSPNLDSATYLKCQLIKLVSEVEL